MDEIVDNKYRDHKAKDDAYVREHSFSARPKLLEMIKNLFDEKI